MISEPFSISSHPGFAEIPTPDGSQEVMLQRGIILFGLVAPAPLLLLHWNRKIDMPNVQWSKKEI